MRAKQLTRTIIETDVTAEPVTLAQAKHFMRETSTAQDALIEQTLIPSARRAVEDFLGRALITRTLKAYDDCFPRHQNVALHLPYPPLVSVTHIKYQDESDVQQTLDSSKYSVDVVSTIGRIVLKKSETWPSTYDEAIDAVEIQFLCGYGSDPDNIPEDIAHAILETISHAYEFRERTVTGTIVAQIPQMEMERIANYRIWTW